jgi:tripartite-type tricarboxylate transporter receptor subunit TctC
VGSPEEFAAVIKADILKLGKVIKEAGLRRDWYTLTVLLASVGVFGKGCVMKRALDKVFFAALSLIPLTAFAQAVLYPTKSVRIVTAGVGGSNDIAARLVAQGLSVTFGQPVIVDNQKDGAVASEVVLRAPADGYTLLLNGSTLWLLHFLRNKVAWDVERDFAPITQAVRTPNMIAVHPSVPIKSVRELIALAKARPGELNYSSSGTGTSNHLSAELFKAMAGVNIVRINYKGTGAAVNDLISGQVQLSFANAAAGMMHVRAGRLRAIAVTSAQPTALAPGLPTVTSSGLPGYEAVSILGIFAPARTPAPILNRLNQEMVRVLTSADVKDKLFTAGSEVVASTPEQLAATVTSEMARMGKVLRDAGIREE